MTALLEYIDLFIKVFFKINSTKNLYGHCRLGRTHSYGPDNQVSFAPPKKFVNIFIGEKIRTLCFKLPCNNKNCCDKSNTSTHYSKQIMNIGSSTVMKSTGIKHLR